MKRIAKMFLFLIVVSLMVSTVSASQETIKNQQENEQDLGDGVNSDNGLGDSIEPSQPRDRSYDTPAPTPGTSILGLFDKIVSTYHMIF